MRYGLQTSKLLDHIVVPLARLSYSSAIREPESPCAAREVLLIVRRTASRRLDLVTNSSSYYCIVLTLAF